LGSDCRVGIVVGLAAEARIARRLGWHVAIGGGTAAGAERAARSLLDSGATALVSVGLAGGLDPSLRPGDLVIPQWVLCRGTRYRADAALSLRLGGTTPHLLLGGDAIVASAADKQRLWRETGAAAVDLESGAVARTAAEGGVPFAVLRAVCDPAERALPRAASIGLDSQGAIAFWRTLASLIAKPRQLPVMLRLATDAVVARRALLARLSAQA